MSYNKEEFLKLQTEDERIQYLINHRPDLDPPKRRSSKPTRCKR